MDPKPFYPPVHVMLKPGKIHVVTSTRQASELLGRDEWMRQGLGPKHIAAAKACLAFNTGKRKSVDAVRRAFEQAAKEINVLVDGQIVGPPRRR